MIGRTTRPNGLAACLPGVDVMVIESPRVNFWVCQVAGAIGFRKPWERSLRAACPSVTIGRTLSRPSAARSKEGRALRAYPGCDRW